MFIFLLGKKPKTKTIVVKVHTNDICVHPSLPNVMSAVFKVLWWFQKSPRFLGD